MEPRPPSRAAENPAYVLSAFADTAAERKIYS
jgi:hypothetical protein